MITIASSADLRRWVIDHLDNWVADLTNEQRERVYNDVTKWVGALATADYLDWPTTDEAISQLFTDDEWDSIVGEIVEQAIAGERQ